MVNKLVKKALGEGKKPTKNVSSGISPSPVSPMSTPPKIAGMDADRYYEAESALSTMKHAGKVMGDRSLQADMKKVAKHKISEIEAASRALGGRVSRGK